MRRMSFVDSHPKSRVYRVRMDVPEHLQGVLNQKTITKTLGTRDPREAKLLAPAKIAEVQRLFANAEAKLAGASSEPSAQDDARDPLVGARFGAVWDPERKRYMWVGFLPMLKSANGLEPGSHQDQPVPIATNALRLRSVLDEWKRDTRPQPRTVQEWERAIRLFIEVNGDLSVPEITKRHVREFKRILLSLPSRMNARERTLTAPEIVRRYPDLPEADRIAPATVEKLMRAISTLIEHARRHYDEVNGNPFHGMIPAAASEKKRLPWTIHALNTLFQSPIYSGCAHPTGRSRHIPGPHVLQDEWYWLPLLGAFTGARLEELGQLRIADVKPVEGIWCLNVTTLDEDRQPAKRLKNEASKRVVPIHPVLRRLGFLHYLEATSQCGSKLLFPNLKPDRTKKMTAKFSRDFGRYRARIGLKGRWLDFHALRHTFKDRLRAATESDEIRDRIMGHATGTVGSSYGDGDPVTKLAEVVARVDYPGLDLSVLLARAEPAAAINASTPAASAHGPQDRVRFAARAQHGSAPDGAQAP